MKVSRRGALQRHITNILVAGLIIVVLFAVYIEYFRNVIPEKSLESLIITIIYGVAIIEILGGFIYLYMVSSIQKEEAGTLRDLFRIVSYAILVVIILTRLGADVTSTLISAGFLGIILGLAAQSTISNFIAGVYLLSSKAFEPGDRVNIHTWQYTMVPQSYPHDKFIPGFYGTIKKIGILYTELTNDDGIPVYIPNNIVAQAMIINYHRATERFIKMQFDVDLDISFARLEPRVRRILKSNGIVNYTLNIEYLHSSLYVISIRVETEMRNVPRLKSKIYSDLLKFIHSHRHSHKHEEVRS